jgi:di/tricarboxylate transporter
MTFEAWIMLAILIVMFGLLIWNKLPTWIVFVGTVAVSMTLRLAPEEDLLKGFANSGVITVGVLFMVAAGMYSTGAITLIADRLIGLPKTLTSAQLKIQPPVAVGSAFLNNTPLVAMMIPVVRDISQSARLAATKLYIPLSFASILGGASTLIGTSTNLIIAGLVADAIAAGALTEMEPISIFDPTLIGLPAAIVGIAFLIIIGQRLLPEPPEKAAEAAEKRFYRAEFIVLPDSPLIGKTVGDAGLASADGYELITLEQEAAEVEPLPEPAAEPKRGIFHRFHLVLREERLALKERWDRVRKKEAIEPEAPPTPPLAEEILEAGDILVFHSDTDSLPGLWAKIGLKPAVGPAEMESERHEHHLVEVVVAPNHPAAGRLVSELPVREPPPYKAELVAVARNGKPIESPIMDMRVETGDNVILEVEDSFFYDTRDQTEFLLTRRLRGYQVQRTERAVIATVITVAMVLLAAFNVMSMLNAALLGSLALLLTGCLSLDRAWRSIEWQTLVVLGAAVGLESAVTATGLSQVIADMLSILGGDNPQVALAVVFIGAIIMTNVITNAAAAAFMFPVALSMANDLGVSFMPFAMVLMLGCSYAFINPAGYQTNLMVQEPGGYTFADYGKVGVPLTIIAGIIAVLLAPIVYGF